MLRPRKCFHTLLQEEMEHKWRQRCRRDLLDEILIHCGWSYRFLEAPRDRMTGSVISIMNCRVEVTTMKRMMLRRKVRCGTCMSIRPVWRASSSSVTPSVTPLGDQDRTEHILCLCLHFWRCIFRTFIFLIYFFYDFICLLLFLILYLATSE